MDINDNCSSAVKSSSILCVMGMHRSGTSVVTRFLHELGAAVAPRLLDAMEGVNPEGFWEDQRIVDINEQLLSARGCRWFDCGDSSVTLDIADEARIRATAIRHIEENYKTQTLSVVKDPRLCRLLPFWLDVWAAAGVDSFFIHVVRHPFAVAKSLQKRDRIPYEYGVVLWLLHTVEALWHSQKYPGLVITYDEFLEHPVALVETLASRFQIMFPIEKAAWAEVAGRSINWNLRHNDNNIEAPLGLRDLQMFAISLYEALDTSAYVPMKSDTLKQWHDQLQQILGRHTDEIGMLKKLSADLMALSAENVRVGELHSAALAVIQAKDGVIADRDQFIKDIVYLKFWRVIPRILRRVRGL